MKQRIIDLLHAIPFRPFTIRTADGQEYHVPHPDYVAAAAATPNIVIEEDSGRVNILSALLVTGIVVSENASA